MAKFLQLRRAGKGFALVGYGSVPLEEAMVIEGVIAEPERLARGLLAALKHPANGHITAHSVASGLPQAHLFSRIITLPAMSHEKLSEAVQWEAQQYIPMPMTDLYLDFEIVAAIKNDQGEVREYEILLAAAPRAIIDSYMKLFEFLKLTPHSLETTLAANIRALHPRGSATEPVMVIDIGSHATDMAIVTDVVRVTTTVNVGGDSFTQTLMRALKIDEPHAVQIKVSYGIAESGIQSKILTALQPQLNLFVNEVKKLVKYHAERGADERTKHVQRLLLTGGISRMPGFAEYLSRQLSLPVDISSPWGHRGMKLPQGMDEATATAYTTAFGLAMRGFVE